MKYLYYYALQNVIVYYYALQNVSTPDKKSCQTQKKKSDGQFKVISYIITRFLFRPNFLNTVDNL